MIDSQRPRIGETIFRESILSDCNDLRRHFRVAGELRATSAARARKPAIDVARKCILRHDEAEKTAKAKGFIRRAKRSVSRACG